MRGARIGSKEPVAALAQHGDAPQITRSDWTCSDVGYLLRGTLPQTEGRDLPSSHV